MNSPRMQPRNFPRKSRLGCVTRFWLLVLGAFVLLLGFEAIFMPWGFYLGGKFHWLPEWTGMGTAHAASGYDYLFFMRVFPEARHPARRSSDLEGSAYVCTPKGEKIRLSLSAYMDKHLDRNTQGEAIEIRMHSSSSYSRMFSGDVRPYLEFKGVWGPDQIAVDDKGSLGRAFDADGSVYRGHSPTRRPAFPPIQFVLRGATSREFEKACSSQM